jgi:hypothetical protein
LCHRKLLSKAGSATSYLGALGQSLAIAFVLASGGGRFATIRFGLLPQVFRYSPARRCTSSCPTPARQPSSESSARGHRPLSFGNDAVSRQLRNAIMGDPRG